MNMIETEVCFLTIPDDVTPGLINNMAHKFVHEGNKMWDGVTPRFTCYSLLINGRGDIKHFTIAGCLLKMWMLEHPTKQLAEQHVRKLMDDIAEIDGKTAETAFSHERWSNPEMN